MRRYAILIVGFTVAAGCARLGLWQVSRLQVRQARNTAIREAMAQPPVDLGRNLFAATANRLVTGAGVFDFSRQVIVEARSFGGTPAAIVVTPFRVPDAPAFLVERGWVPSPDGRVVPLGELDEPSNAVVEGILLGLTVAHPAPPDTAPWPVRVRWADPTTLAPRYPYAMAPLVIRRTNVPADTTGPRLHAVPLPAVDNGPHLAYAIQWFAFAVIAAVGSVLLYRKERGGRDH